MAKIFEIGHQMADLATLPWAFQRQTNRMFRAVRRAVIR